MQKRNVFFALFFAVILVLLSHLGTKMAQSAPAFSYAAEEKRIYLTFDDGPSTVVTNRILDTLKEENVKATFFIVSDRAKTRRETLLRIAQEGHTVGVHSASHDYSKIYSSDEALLTDVKTCADFIYSVTGTLPTVYRFPGGKGTPAMHSLVQSAGYRVVGWNAVCGDEEIPCASAQMLVEESVKTAGNRQSVVLLLHDSAPHRQTAEALPSIIAHFHAQGYEFCAF